MPNENDFQEVMNIYLESYRKLVILQKSLSIVLPNERIPYSKMIFESLWTNLLDHSDKQIQYYSDKLKEVCQMLSLLTSMRQNIGMLKKMSKSLKPVNINVADWEKEKAVLLEKLISQNLPPEKANKQVDFIGNLSGKYINSSLTDIFSRKEKLINKYIIAYMVPMAGSVLARYVAGFNIEAAKPLPSCSIDDILQWKESTANKLEGLEKEIYKGLLEDEKTPSYYIDIIQKSKEILAEGTLFASQCNNLCGSNAANKQRQYDLAWEIGDIQRWALRINIIAIYIDIISKDYTGSIYSEWSKASKKLEFKSIKVDTGETISGLRADKDLVDGRFITIRGLISNIVIVKLRNKDLSLVKMSDDYGNAITVVLPYINFDSAGATIGSYVRLSGTYYKNVLQRHLKSVPDEYKETLDSYCVDGLEIDRINYTKLSKENWNYWSISKIKPFFDPIPHGLEISWSWTAGRDGAGNQLRYGTWYKQ